MLDSQPFEPNREFDIAGPNDVLNLEFQETCIEPKLLDDPRIWMSSESVSLFQDDSGVPRHVSRGVEGLQPPRLHETGNRQSEKITHISDRLAYCRPLTSRR